MKFYLRPDRSPTYYNIAQCLMKKNWHKTRLSFLAHFSEKVFNYDKNISRQLEYKHFLAKLVQYSCPEVMPETICINDSSWKLSLDKLGQTHNQDKTAWILKPALLNNGQEIHIFNHISEIKSHYIQNNRMGGEHILQHYITTPHLLKGPNNTGHKYSLRMFMVLTNYQGAFLYPHGYFNIAVTPYDANNFYDLSGHITNEHLQEDRVNVIQIPSFKYDLFKPIYPKIKSILTQVIFALEKKYPSMFLNANVNANKKLAIFGVDFIVDVDQRVWLIEANHGPCFPITQTHDLQASLYADFWKNLIEEFVQPIGKKTPVEQIQYTIFDRLD